MTRRSRTSFSTRPRRRTLLTGALAAVAASLGADTPDALAGNYPMYACDVPGVNLTAPTRAAWDFWDTSGHVQIHGQCATENQTFFQINYPYGVFAQGAAVGLKLEIPSTGPTSAISIARVTDWTDTALAPGGAGEAPAVGVGLAPSISLSPGGSTSGWNGVATSGSGHDSGALAAGTKSHQLGVACSLVGGGYGNCSLSSPFLRIRGLKTTLSEDVQPSGAMSGGSLMAGGAMRGSRTLTWDAGDDESGIRRVDALLDGIVVASEDFHRDHSVPVAQQTGACEYVALRPCPASRSGVLTVNTAAVPDGAYEVGLRVTDAAGNTATSFSGSPAVIDNVPDTVPPTTSVSPTGSGVTKDSPTANVATVLNGTNASASAVVRASFAESRRGTIRSRYGRQVLITGKIATAAGTPVIGAKVSVLQQDKVVGAPMVPVTEVTTDAAGTFRYVAKAERSRTVRFGYRAHLGDTAFAHTTDIALGVIPRLTLATSATSLRNGQAVRFTGSVAGAPATARKVIELQVRKGNGWMTFRSTRLRRGRYSEAYRFTRTHGRHTYVFRARVREEAGFPFLTGVSGSKRVTVRG